MNRPMTVSQLSSYLKGVFDDEELLHDVTLSGEVSDISYSDKHTFLTLSENDCYIKCVRFNARDPIEKGVKIALKGSVRFYGKKSSVSFNYTEYFLCGEGDKNAKLLALKSKLSELGYFENRPQLPRYITNVVAVTSPDGAAIRDLLRVVSEKCPFVRVRVYPVKVQGEGAAAQMTQAVNALQKLHTDAIVLCRGGGSDEDLSSFNDEALAVAVAQSKVPVISAVGHEIDYTLCDFCVGTRAGTPSIAGQIINAHAQALVNDLYAYAERAQNAVISKQQRRAAALEHGFLQLGSAVRKCVDGKKRELMLTAHRAHYALAKRTAVKKSRLTAVAKTMTAAADKMIIKRRSDTQTRYAQLKALDPQRILRTGYASVVSDGRAVKSAAQLKKGDHVRLDFSDGTVTATVESVLKKA